jgi:hypothetical protein
VLHAVHCGSILCQEFLACLYLLDPALYRDLQCGFQAVMLDQASLKRIIIYLLYDLKDLEHLCTENVLL